MASPLFVNLDDIDKLSPAIAGNKAFNQALLRRHGVNCPSGICITTTFFLELINQNGSPCLSNDRTAAARARRALRNAVIGSNVKDTVRDFLNQLNSAPEQRALCVRSSSPLEDTKSASFAGQFFSICGVANVEDTVNAIKSCYMSLYSDTALLYCQRHDISVADLAMAVLVQEMIDCEKFGVMFTRHPLTKADEFFVEATFGFGSPLVGGRITPDAYVLSHQGGVISQRLGRKSIIARYEPSQGLVADETPREKSAQYVFNSNELSELAKIGRHCVEILGADLDIELGIRKGTVWILQARPITAYGK